MNFAALVIGKDIGGQLAPFMRNSCNEPEKRYMMFYDQEDALLHSYKRCLANFVLVGSYAGRCNMPQDGTKHRKFAAIMFTDMVGYSALAQRNEALALELLEEQRRLMRTIFPKHEGTEIKTIGDGFLIEFSSALAAVLCGIEIQEAITKRNSANPSQGNFQVRIGIHAGDVVRHADDMIGDGVNIAARIVPLGGEGGICISQQVFDQVENHLAKSLKRMGSVTLKNIRQPLEVYWVEYEGATSGPPNLEDEQFYRDTESIAFPRLDDHQLSLLEPLGNRRVLKRGELVFKAGQRDVGLNIILRGELEAFEQRDGVEQILATVHEGDFTGDVAMLQGTSVLSTARVTSDRRRFSTFRQWNSGALWPRCQQSARRSSMH